MGLFGFGKGGGGKIERLEKKVTNKWGQSFERLRAMQQLADIGSDEALKTLLKRFTFRTEGGIADEEEKRQAFDYLVAAGERAVPAIEDFVSTQDGVYWPLRAVKEIVGIDRAVELLLRALDRAETVEGRINEVKVQLVSNMRDFQHPRTLERLKALCHDPNDDVRIMAVDAILTYGEKDALPVIAERILDTGESPRIKGVVFEQLIELEWSVESYRAALEEAGVIPPNYKIGPAGKVERAG
ncbi:MAG: HEAT repeat domain-containing protein [Deltaproteobacteria bacterium]|nr:HEAT repeat domain-containing protein [Deltaproteobacteria bacterium]